MSGLNLKALPFDLKGTDSPGLGVRRLLSTQ
jgi:hypothetical protein